MPIKLLHHKSWHVYSRDNIERVKQDEAKEAARLKAQEAELLHSQSQKRLALLRNGQPDNSIVTEPEPVEHTDPRSRPARPAKRKRENDIALVDRHLDARRTSSAEQGSALPKSEFVTHAESAVTKTTHDTFSALDRPVWYTRGSERSAEANVSDKRTRRLEKLKISQDPLQNMKQLIAGKKALRLEKMRSTVPDTKWEAVQPDQYHADKVRRRESRHDRRYDNADSKYNGHRHRDDRRK